MIIGKPAPFVRAFVDAVDEAIRAHQPSHGMGSVAKLLFRVVSLDSVYERATECGHGTTMPAGSAQPVIDRIVIHIGDPAAPQGIAFYRDSHRDDVIGFLWVHPKGAVP